MRKLHPSKSLVVTFSLFLALAGAGCASEEAPTPDAAPADTGTETASAEAAEATVTLVSQADLIEQIEADQAPMILDVRTVEEFNEGHVPGAINIPHTELGERLAEVEAAREAGMVVYCRSGRRAGIAEELLLEAGFQNVMHLEGDMSAWIEAALPTQKPEQ